MASAGQGDQTQSAVRVNGFNDVPKPFLIGVGGGTASGKSTVCSKIMAELGQNDIDQKQKQVVIISQESFYYPLSEEDQPRASRGQYNFDHPSAVDDELILHTLSDLKQGKAVKIPEYDFVTHCRKQDAWRTVYPADVILFEGILVFYFKDIRELFDMKLFVDTDADTRLSRRVVRDIEERGRDLDQILHQYTSLVKPAFEEFCLPTKKYADVIIPRGADNTVAIGLIVQHIQDLLKPNGKLCVKRLRHNSDSLLEFRYEPDAKKYIKSNRPH